MIPNPAKAAMAAIIVTSSMWLCGCAAQGDGATAGQPTQQIVAKDVGDIYYGKDPIRAELNQEVQADGCKMLLTSSEWVDVDENGWRLASSDKHTYYTVPANKNSRLLALRGTYTNETDQVVALNRVVLTRALVDGKRNSEALSSIALDPSSNPDHVDTVEPRQSVNVIFYMYMPTSLAEQSSSVDMVFGMTPRDSSQKTIDACDETYYIHIDV